MTEHLPNWAPNVPRYDQLYSEADTGSAWDYESGRWRTFKQHGSADWPIWVPVAESGQNDQTCQLPPTEGAT